MPITVHPDLFFINMFPNLFYSQGVWEIFSFIDENFPATRLSYYTLFTYYSFALFQFPYHFISDSFSKWMTDLYQFYINRTEIAYTKDYLQEVTNAFLFRDIFLAKIPYLIADLASLIILFKFIKSRYLKPKAILVWLFAPVIIYSTYMHGQYDIIPSFFVLLGFFLLKRKTYPALIAFGVAAAFKNYSLLFVLIISLVYGKSVAEKIKMILIGCVPYAISLVPVVINDPQLAIYSIFPKPYFQTSALLSGWPLVSRYLHLAILILFQLLILLVAYVIRTKDKWQRALGLSLAAILFVLTFAPLVVFHYLLWALPLLVLWVRNIKKLFLFTAAQTLFATSFMLLANHVQLGLFAPVDNQYFSNLATFNQVIDRFFPYWVISSTGYFAFVITNLSLCTAVFVKLLFKNNVKS